MTIKVRFFASLADRVGKREVAVAVEGIQTAQDVWNKAVQNQQIPNNTKLAINQQYAKLDSVVQDGDEIAFFPPVTGG